MPKKFDLVAIGTGSGASAAASRCRSAGWQVAIVDSRPFGGTCALRGCDPKKVLVGAVDAIDCHNVPFHPGRNISPSLLRQIARDVGLSIEDFLATE